VWVSEMPPATNFCSKKTTGSRYVISPKTVTSLKIAFSIYKWKLRDRKRVEKKEKKFLPLLCFCHAYLLTFNCRKDGAPAYC